jgi:hypothetical protein
MSFGSHLYILACLEASSLRTAAVFFGRGGRADVVLDPLPPLLLVEWVAYTESTVSQKMAIAERIPYYYPGKVRASPTLL